MPIDQKMKTPDLPFFQRNAIEVAPDLIGCLLSYHNVGGTIVESEAYEIDDPASHSFRGLSKANAAMFGQPGNVYVYRSYGIHFCLNIVCRRGSAVLIRAIEPVMGIPSMQERRRTSDIRLLCSGPGKLCQALGISLEDNEKLIGKWPFSLSCPTITASVVTGRRIGISKAVDLPWRFGLEASRFVSRKFLLD